MSADDEVQQVVAAVAHLRARHAAFAVAADDIRNEQFHEAVEARWDGAGNLLSLDIAANALRDFTNLELEDIVTDVLRRTRQDMGDRFQTVFEKYLGFGSPNFDPDILGVPFVPLPPRPGQ